MTRVTYLIALAAVASCAGCSIPLSLHPLSDETTSVLDERLIGHWEAVKDGEPMEPLHVAPRFVFGRVADKPNVLEMVNLELEGDAVKVNRTPAFATKLGEERYLSVLNNPEEAKDAHMYLILMYRLDDDRLKLFILRPDVVGPAIERGDLKGEVVREPPDPDAPPPEQVKPKYKSIKITASPKELAEYLTPRGAAPFHPQEFFQFRRVEPQ
jgi:hypothetical protein